MNSPGFEKVYAFVDEFGNPSLETDKEGVSSHFIISAILVRESALDEARSKAESIRNKNFQFGEMKSSTVSKDDARRIRILTEISELPINAYLFIVDKRRIRKDSGLLYKKSFIKFLHLKVYDKLFRVYDDIEAYADEHGGKEFMDGFYKYIENNATRTLFTHPRLTFISSKSDPLIQVSDMIAGSMARIYDTKKLSENPENIKNSIRSKILSLEQWPPAMEDISTVRSNDYDEMVRIYCKNSAASYLARMNDQSLDGQMRESVMLHLCMNAELKETDRFSVADALLEHLAECGFEDQNINYLRSKIIAHFRDEGVIIASDARGYKLPTCTDDLLSYVSRCSTVIDPMILRLRNAREQILMISHNEMDILDEYPFLKNICNS